jgi:nucleotide-binding universal stress UspA family protein
MPGILLAMHGRPSAEGATRVAALLAARLAEPLHGVVVEEPFPVVDYAFGVTIAPSAEEEARLRAALRADTEAQLRRYTAEHSAPELRLGLVVDEIVGAACADDAALIVTGLGPHALIDRALGGEIALHLAQTARTPVLAVSADATEIPRTVVAAIDFSATSLRAARTVARWLLPGDTLHLVHVTPGRPTPALDSDAQARLREAAEHIGLARGVRVEAAELHGGPAPALLEYLARVHGDLLALGSHGYGAWKRLALGSVASKVIRVATTSVLVAPIGCV